MTHYFLALRFDKKTKDTFKRVSQFVEETVSRETYKIWVNDADYHLTLHFFGPLEGKTTVIDMIKRLTLPTIPLVFSKVSGFGRSAGYRVIFLEPQVTESLRALYELIQDGLASRGFEITHRSFHPHVTIAKKCQVLWNKEHVLSQINTALMTEYLPIDTQAISLALYKIEPNKTPKYTVVFERLMR